MGYENPLLSLPSAKMLLARPLQKRLALSVLFRQVRAEANDKAVEAWARRQHHAGAFWRATSTYARHVAHLLCQDNPLDVKPNKMVMPRTASVSVEYRYALLNLAGSQAVLESSLDERRVLAMLFKDLQVASRIESENSWIKRKSPMAAYWSDVAKHARRIARLLNRADPLGIAPAISSSTCQLTALLAGLASSPSEIQQCKEIA